ncbi:hypothetical protein D3C80_1883010 [compost metagenome]
MADLVNDGVFEHGLRCKDQVPVKIDLPVLTAATPHMLLVLDLHPTRPQPVALTMQTDEVAGVVAHAAFQPEPESALYDGVGGLWRQVGGLADLETVAEADLDQRAVEGFN